MPRAPCVTNKPSKSRVLPSLLADGVFSGNAMPLFRRRRRQLDGKATVIRPRRADDDDHTRRRPYWIVVPFWTGQGAIATDIRHRCAASAYRFHVFDDGQRKPDATDRPNGRSTTGGKSCGTFVTGKDERAKYRRRNAYKPSIRFDVETTASRQLRTMSTFSTAEKSIRPAFPPDEETPRKTIDTITINRYARRSSVSTDTSLFYRT